MRTVTANDRHVLGSNTARRPHPDPIRRAVPDDFDRAAQVVKKTLRVIGLAGAAGEWVDKNYEAFTEQVERWGLEPDHFLHMLLQQSLELSKQTTDAEISKALTIVNERTKQADWSKDDDDHEDSCPNGKCEHSDARHGVDGECQICNCPKTE